MSSRRERLRVYQDLRRRYRPDRREFERLVGEAIRELPKPLRERLSNVAIVVAEWPAAGETSAVRLAPDTDLLGLYQGTPIGERGTAYHLVPPDRVTIYRRPILQSCRTEEEVRAEIRATVLHEIGHYFGLGDDELE